ncbi:MAG TPA: hypothetical protein VL155_08070 [Terriglobales bacterium]|jgi:hypothetical protein|nr:hypothetical protein [Terriglobales bacterium]HTM88141.1 hypothetical protein [Terriglobales bacterium]
MRTTRRKILLALLLGLMVSGVTIGLDLSFVRLDHLLAHLVIAGSIAGLLTIIFTLALQLKQEEQHYMFAAERAAVLAEVNHHVRNAIFPLCVAVNRNGDPDASRLVTECVERINMALRDASVDATVGRYSRSRPQSNTQKAAA